MSTEVITPTTTAPTVKNGSFSSSVPTSITENEASTLEQNVLSLIDKQKEFFSSQITKDIDFRIAQLKKLKKTITKYEKEILEALKLDLNKHKFEGYGAELGLVYLELDKTLKHLRKWAKPTKRKTALFHAIGSSYTYYDPFGRVLIIAPWNYPFQLAFLPIIGALAAGNCVTLKPSELSVHTTAIMDKIIKETFDERYVACVQGAIPETTALLNEHWDFIFFTGSTAVGKIVYQAAAKHLTPVVLELGGKSPCIVDKDVALDVAAKRIAWGKLLNNGQTCIAPDYLLVHEDIKEELVAKIKEKVVKFYGKDASKSKSYGRIISERHVKRLAGLMQGGDIIFGGQIDHENRYISPTLIDNVSPDAPIMKEEIFGPILPILTFKELDEAIQFINDRPKPLALYIFSKDKDFQQRVLNETSSGGGCVNDTLMHCANDNMAFGGVGESGIGGYHGEHSFKTFSHQKNMLHKSTAVDPYIRYAPYNSPMRVLKSLLKRFG